MCAGKNIIGGVARSLSERKQQSQAICNWLTRMGSVEYHNVTYKVNAKRYADAWNSNAKKLGKLGFWRDISDGKYKPYTVSDEQL